MADSSHAAKTLVIKAEDARILGDIAAVRSCYAQLYTLNAELIGEYNKRANNHEQARGPACRMGTPEGTGHRRHRSSRLPSPTRRCLSLPAAARRSEGGEPDDPGGGAASRG